MINLETFRLELLDSLYYNSYLDSGAAGAALTAPFVGDIAMMYATCRSLGIGNLNPKITSSPHYEELADCPFIISVAHSVSPVKMLPVYDFATSFMSEGYEDLEAFKASFNAPFRNWIRKQGLSAGNVFYFSVAYRDYYRLPSTYSVRLGNMRSCIAKVSKVEESPPQEYDIWGNLFTAGLVRKRWNPGEKPPSPPGPSPMLEILSSYYEIVKGLDGTSWRSMVSPYE